MKQSLLNLSLSSAIASCIVLSSGCAHHEGAYGTKDPDLYSQELTMHVALMDKQVQRSVKAAGGIKIIERADGRLDVFANIMNRESRRIQVQVQCVFQDADGLTVGDETPWENVILTENAMKTLSYTSLSTKAKSFVIRVRQAR